MQFSIWFLGAAAVLFGLSLFYFYKGNYLVGSMLLVVSISTAFGVLIWKRRRQTKQRFSDTQSETFDFEPRDEAQEHESEHESENESKHESKHESEHDSELDRYESNNYDIDLRDAINERSALISAISQRLGLSQ